MMLLSLGNANMDKRGLRKREEGFQCAQEARALFAEMGDRRYEAEALNVLSFCANKRESAPGNTVAIQQAGQEARAFATRARELAVELGDRRLEVEAINLLAAGYFA